MHIETYKEMKRTYIDLTEPESKLWLITTNPIFSIVYDIDDSTIWAGWRPRHENTIPNAIYFELTECEAKNFNKEIYDKAINTLLYKVKQENLKNKLNNIEKDF